MSGKFDRSKGYRRRFTRKKLGELLISMGKITPDERSCALDYAKICKQRLGEALVQAGVINTYTLYRGLAKQTGIKFIEQVTKKKIDETAVKLVSEIECLEHSFIPVFFIERKLVVVMTDPNLKLQIEDVLKREIPNQAILYGLVRPEELEILFYRFYNVDFHALDENQVDDADETDFAVSDPAIVLDDDENKWSEGSINSMMLEAVSDASMSTIDLDDPSSYGPTEEHKGQIVAMRIDALMTENDQLQQKVKELQTILDEIEAEKQQLLKDF